MTTLVLDRSHLGIRHEGGALVLFENGSRRGTVPMKLLERVVIQSASLDLTAGAMLRLCEHGVSVLFLSARHSRRVAIVLGPQHNDATVRLAQAGLVSDVSARQVWSNLIVQRKLTRQRSLLAELRDARPDSRKPLTDALRGIDQILGKLTASPHLIGSLRGMEGAAAACYFQGLKSVFPPALRFVGRNRRPPRDPVNACLSLGYTLLHFDAVRAAHTAGLDPLLGFYHQPAFGRESLACDLVEPMRPLVDRWVWRLLADRVLRHEDFNFDKGACLLGKAGRSRFYSSWEDAAKLHRRYLRRQCAAIARDFRDSGARSIEAMEGFDDDEVFPA